ncbi:speract receptor-like [Glandiceps talaboti]
MTDPFQVSLLPIGKFIAGAFDMAITDANEMGFVQGPNSSNLGYHVEYSWVDTYGKINKGLQAVANHWRDGYHGIIGPGNTCSFEARFASSLNMPMVDYLCDESAVSDKTVYKTFARTKPSNSEIAHAILLVFNTFGWRRCSLVSSDDQNFVSITDLLLTLFEEDGIEVTNHHVFPGTYVPNHSTRDYHDWPNVIKSIRKTTRIYLFVGKIIHHRDFIVQMYKDKVYVNKDTVVIATSVDHFYHGLRGYVRDWLDPTDDQIAKQAIKYSLIIEFRQPLMLPSKYYEFSEESIRRTHTIFNGPEDFVFDNKGFFLYDAAMQMCSAMNSTLADGKDIADGNTVMSYIFKSTFASKFNRYTYINENGDALGEYDLKSWQLYDLQTFISFGIYFDDNLKLYQDYGMIHASSITKDTETGKWIYDPDAYSGKIQWPNDEIPLDMPECGFFNELCPETDVVTVTVIPVCAIIVCLFIALYFLYRKRKYEADLDNLVWKVNWDDVTTRGDHKKSQALSMKSMFLSTVSLFGNQEKQQIFTKICTYKSKICAMKAVNKHHIVLTRAVRKELKEMRDLHHDNVNKFIGACVTRPHISILMEYCAKGSLQDILENSDIKLENMFIATLIADIIKGMTYIHNSSIKSHGNLKSSNCVVDNRWLLQITDYGLHEFKKGQLADNDDEYSESNRLLWRAPEHLRQGQQMPEAGSQKGDVYSFAIILQEIYSRAQPYHLNIEEPEEIVQKLIAGLEPPFRPDLSDVNEEAPECVLKAIRICWDEDPERRPDFPQIGEQLQPLHEGLKPNILDNMIALMEKYTNNLEELINDRTEDLRREKKKIDLLLNRMLPPSISHQLMNGIQVQPEVYETVTIFFSDIVGFTALSAVSTPIQVVNMLNDLYIRFDAIVSNYDVYKVETIGDAYMLVSGLPIRNGINHAGQIASAAIHLLDGVSGFKIRHLPDEELSLRIGLHTGSCLAGVVGLKMPRYCLFGDTVNIASRMESNGLPSRIHLSSQCKKNLDKLGGFTLELRGEIDIKGAGQMTTYWLIDQDPIYKIEKFEPPEQV